MPHASLNSKATLPPQVLADTLAATDPETAAQAAAAEAAEAHEPRRRSQKNPNLRAVSRLARQGAGQEGEEEGTGSGEAAPPTSPTLEQPSPAGNPPGEDRSRPAGWQHSRMWGFGCHASQQTESKEWSDECMGGACWIGLIVAACSSAVLQVAPSPIDFI